MSVITAALALLFAFVVLAQPTELRVDYAPTMRSSR